MASISTYLDIRREKKSGEYPLKFNISINRGKKFLINLNIDITQEQWNGTEIVKHDKKVLLNQYIRMRRTQIEDELLKLEVSGRINTLSPEDIKLRVENIFSRTGGSGDYYVKTHWEYFLSFKERRATFESYEQTLLKISTFSNLETLMFPHINPIWLRDFEQFMKKQGLAINTIAIHMRNIRSVFNDAINTDKIGQDLYPFRKYKIKSEKTVKRSLTIEQVKKIRDFECEPHQVRFRDLFMLIFYMQGINIVDLLHLKSLNNGRAEFKRSKTGRLYSIMVEEEAQTIIDKYKGENYLLNILDVYSNYRDFRHRMNDNLQKIGKVEFVDRKNGRIGKKEITPLFPDLTTYWARHTWATIAAGLDIPKETIAAALGHGGNTVTDIYISFDMKKVDEANRKVLDAVR